MPSTRNRQDEPTMLCTLVIQTYFQAYSQLIPTLVRYRYHKFQILEQFDSKLARLIALYLNYLMAEFVMSIFLQIRLRFVKPIQTIYDGLVYLHQPSITLLHWLHQA